jgi:hypothetical protein
MMTRACPGDGDGALTQVNRHFADDATAFRHFARAFGSPRWGLIRINARHRSGAQIAATPRRLQCRPLPISTPD